MTQSKTFNEFWNKPETIALRKKMTIKRYKISTKYTTEFNDANIKVSGSHLIDGEYKPFTIV